MGVKKTKSYKYVTFKSGDEYFGIKIDYVNEIIVYQEITKIPESEDYIKGLINLRGKIIPVIDVRLRFKQEPIEYTDRTCIIVIKVKNTVVGLIVEKIAEVVEINHKDIIPSPSLAKVETVHNRYVYAVGKVGDGVKLLLDPDKLLNDAEIAAFEELDKDEEEVTIHEELMPLEENDEEDDEDEAEAEDADADEENEESSDETKADEPASDTKTEEKPKETIWFEAPGDK